jgi:hypothetical protein
MIISIYQSSVIFGFLAHQALSKNLGIFNFWILSKDNLYNAQIGLGSSVRLTIE